MKNYYAAAALAAVTMAFSGSAEAAPYASGMKVTSANASGFAVAFNLNDDSLATKMIIKNSAGVEVRSIDLGAMTKGAKTANWNGRDASGNALPTDNYDWFIEATGAARTEATLLSNDTNPNLQFSNLRAIAVQNNPETSTFGNVYATEVGPALSPGGRTTVGKGIFMMNALLEDYSGQGPNAYTGNAAFAASTSVSAPYRIWAAPSGEVFITSYADAVNGMWIFDPLNPSAAMKQLWGGTAQANGTYTDGDGKIITGNNVTCLVKGTGAETVLYTSDEDKMVGDVATVRAIWKYNIGTVREGYTTLPEVFFGDTAGLTPIGNDNCALANDGFGGFWFGQYRAADAVGIPSLMHISAAGVKNWNSGTTETINFGNSINGAMAVTEDGKRLALTTNGKITVCNIQLASAEAAPVVTKEFDITTNVGANMRQIAFDAAGNLYVAVQTTGYIKVFALPQANNTTEIKAPATQKMQLPLAKISDWELN